MSHFGSVFRNSCLSVPVDPDSKMPKTFYERRAKQAVRPQSSVDTSSSCSIVAADLDVNKLKDFYKSIPDYNDIHHLPEDEFYDTLKNLRDKKKLMLGIAIEHIDDCDGDIDKTFHVYAKSPDLPCAIPNKILTKMHSTSRRKSSFEGKGPKNPNKGSNRAENLGPKPPATCLKQPAQRSNGTDENKNLKGDLKVTSLKSNLEKSRDERPNRNHSACSISWNDKIEPKTAVDQKFDEYFIGKRYPCQDDDDDDFKTRSMPTSPLRIRRRSPSRNRSITIPKPFKMTERDEEEHIVNELRSLQKSFSDDMLHQKCNRSKFRAKPVPIESRIPLYDKILQDQAMSNAARLDLPTLETVGGDDDGPRARAYSALELRDSASGRSNLAALLYKRAISKINSEAELRAQMKPFSFTKREEKGDGICERATHVLPKMKKKKRFRARPVPKNLFSNYFYNRVKEDEFFRSMNKRIRAEEMLRTANYPGSMAARDRSRLSTPAAHSDLPIDPSPAIPSSNSSDRRCASPVKKRREKGKDDFITTSPQPFKFNTADRAAKKMQEVTKKIYQDSKSTGSVGGDDDGPRARAYSALELRASASGRSNLAALLRAEAVRQKFDMESARRLAEQRRRNEMKHRDRLLRSKPAWHLVKNNCEEDIAMRLQTRRDEERMRREEFMHEMELMYGRVQEQPMLFERYYAPRSFSALDAIESMEKSPRKTRKKCSKKYHYNSPTRSRKVSINDNAETYHGDVAEYLNSINIDDKISDSEVSLDRDKY